MASGQTLAGAAPPPAGRRIWRDELTETVKLALPIALTQLGQIAMMTSDLALIGRLGDQAVAAAALAHTVLFTVFVLGMGHRLGGGAARRAGLRRAAAAHGAPRVARRTVGRGHSRRAAHRRRSSGAARSCVALGQSREAAELAQRYLFGIAWCLVPGWCFMALRNFMGAVNRPEPGALDHACGDPGECAARLCADLRRVRPAAARSARRRPCDHDRQHRHVRRGDLGVLRAPAVPQISRARPLVARGLDADAPADRRRRADVRLVPARIRRVRRRRATDGLDRHRRARRASDRAADRRRSCSWCRSASAMAATVRVGHAVGRGDAAATRRAGFVGDRARRRRSWRR